MKLKNKSYLIFLLVSSLFVTGCSIPFIKSKNNPSTAEEMDNSEIEPTMNTGQLIDDRKVYDSEIDDIIHLYITVLEDGGSRGKNVTFYQLNHWYDIGNIGEESPKLEAIIAEGDSNGPQKGKLGYGMKVSNATVEIRGNSSRLVPQKSYQIKLSDNAGLWQGQSVINLNKHMYDITRVRNKLSFDYFKEIPNMTSLRTQFVHLYVKDLTSDQQDENYIDYGLFTQIEQPNKRFLYAHGLDPNGNLYKANFFEFHRYHDQLKLATDPDYNKDDFETILQIKGSKDHNKLLKMLDDVNNYNLDINEVVKKYFDRENYLTWLAVNLLVGNIDTDAQNYFLYSPLNSEKFYFLPWDYDAAWGQQNEESAQIEGFTTKWQLGISNYWGSVLHQRFFKDPTNVEDLSSKIEELSKIMTEQKTKEYLDKYYPIVNAYIKKSPDLDRLPFRIEDFDKSYNNLVNIPQQNKEIYYKNLENPMPIYLGESEMIDDDYQFTWDPSYDLQGDDITYDFQVSDSMNFKTVYIERKNLTSVSENISLDDLKTGKNYWRVIIKDSKGNTQEAFDRIEGDDQTYYNGIKEFYVD